MLRQKQVEKAQSVAVKFDGKYLGDVLGVTILQRVLLTSIKQHMLCKKTLAIFKKESHETAYALYLPDFYLTMRNLNLCS